MTHCWGPGTPSPSARSVGGRQLAEGNCLARDHILLRWQPPLYHHWRLHTLPSLRKASGRPFHLQSSLWDPLGPWLGLHHNSPVSSCSLCSLAGVRVLLPGVHPRNLSALTPPSQSLLPWEPVCLYITMFCLKCKTCFGKTKVTSPVGLLEQEHWHRVEIDGRAEAEAC